MKKDVNVTARVRVANKQEVNEGQQNVSFMADYEDGRNKEWAKYTPALSLTMVLNGEVADHFELGDKITLTFSKTGEESDGDDGSKSTDE
jgi:hypothetical protein